MSQNPRVWVLERSHDPLGHLLDRLVEAAVHAGHHHVHLRQRRVVEIERPVGENIHLDARKHPDPALHLGVDLANALDVRQRARVVQTVRHRQMLGVVGDRNISEPPCQRRLGHLADGVAAVGRIGVHVQIAANIRQRNQLRQRVRCRSLQFAAVLAQLGRDVVEIQRAIDLLLARGRDDHVVFQPQQGILAQRQPALDGALAQRHIVHLRSRKVLQRRTIARARKQPDVHLQIISQRETDLVLPLRHQLVDQRQRRHMLDRGRDHIGLARRPGHQQVEIAHRLATAAQRARRRNLLDARKCPDQLRDAVRELMGLIGAEAAGVAPVILDALQQLGGELLAHPRQGIQMALPGRRLQRIDIGDLQRGPDQRDRLRPHPRQAQQLEHRRLVLLQQLLPQRHRPRRHQIADIRRHALADAGNRQQFLGVRLRGRDRGQLGGLLLHRLGRAPVGADPERVCPVDLEQRCRLLQQPRDGDIVHELPRPSPIKRDQGAYPDLSSS